MNIIEKYPKIFKMYEGNPGGINWVIPKGWETTIDWMCGTVQDYIDHTKVHSKDGISSPHQVECLQIKEKFGSLRFYTNGNDDQVDGMIKFAEYLSKKTCVDCGSMEEVEMTAGWIMPVCSKCYKENYEHRGTKLLKDVR